MNLFPHIIVGTYEEFVLGFKIEYIKDDFSVDKQKHDQKYEFSQSFATHSHQASIRCIAAQGQLMASSGADEYINIYNMEKMKILSYIDYHNSTVTSLEFTPDGSFLITASEKGDIAIFRCNDWSLVKQWKKAHSHALGVSGISCHPTGTLFMSTGKDNILRFWNLVKGKLVYAVDFSKNCSMGDSLNFALWSPTGKYYGISIGKTFKLYKTKTAAIIYEAKTNSKITCATFIKKSILSIGTEEGQLEFHSPIHKKLLYKKETSKFRIKSIISFEHIFSNKKGEPKIQHYLATADSKGLIKLFRIKKKGLTLGLEEKCQVDCDCRITCLTAVYPKSTKTENEGVKNEDKKDVNFKNQKEKSLKSNKFLKQVCSEINGKRKEKLLKVNEEKKDIVNKSSQISKTEKVITNLKKKKRKFLEIENGKIPKTGLKNSQIKSSKYFFKKRKLSKSSDPDDTVK